MSVMRGNTESLTDEQILSSAYMCCQRSAVKYAHKIFADCNSNARYLSSRNGKREFKERHRQSHYSINYWRYIKTAAVIFLITAILYPIAEAMLIPPNWVNPSQVIFIAFWIFIAVFPIIRRIIIEIDISKKYSSLMDELNGSSEKDLSMEASYAKQLSEMDDYLAKHCVIPKKYWDYALNLVEYIYVDCRADNLKEAINVLEDDLHKSRLENKMSEIEELAVKNANAIDDMMERIDNIECFQDYLEQRQQDLEWDVRIAKSRADEARFRR